MKEFLGVGAAPAAATSSAGKFKPMPCSLVYDTGAD
jgi:hypothetical protein